MSEAIDDSILEALSDADLQAYLTRLKWLSTARKEQLLPPGDDWDTCVWIAGRFFGKTRCIVEPSWYEAYRVPGIRIHALAPTLGDVRRTFFEGESGFLAKTPPELIASYNKTDKEIKFTNGSMILGFACVEEADRLRGPQCQHLIFDEAAAADRPAGNLESAWRVAALGCRLPMPDGSRSLKLIATTPRPIPFLKRLIRREGVVTVRGSSYQNFANISEAARREVRFMEGTSYSRQEVYGDFIDEASDLAILKRAWIRLWPVDPRNGLHKPLPVLSYIVTSYDTAASEEDIDHDKQESDPTACIVLGVFNVNEAFTEAERKKYHVHSKYACILLDAWGERLGLPALLDKAKAFNAKKYGPPDRSRRTDMTLIEDKSSGPGVRQFMRTWGLRVYPMKPRVSKTMRTHSISPLVFQGMLWVPESTRPDKKGLPIGWADEFVDQITAFAGEGSVEHDDYLDCVTQAFQFLHDKGMLEATPEVEFVDREEKIEHDRREAERQYRTEKNLNKAAPYG